jgi:hypothetical protein
VRPRHPRRIARDHGEVIAIRAGRAQAVRDRARRAARAEQHRARAARIEARGGEPVDEAALVGVVAGDPRAVEAQAVDRADRLRRRRQL